MRRWQIVLMAFAVALSGCGKVSRTPEASSRSAEHSESVAWHADHGRTGSATPKSAPVNVLHKSAEPTMEFPAGAADPKAEAPMAGEGRAAREVATRDFLTDPRRPAAPPAMKGDVPAFKDESRPTDPAPRPQHQAGQLTAGSIDDQRGFAAYLDFVNRSPLRPRLPMYLPSSRVVVTVRNDMGERVPEARVLIRPVTPNPGPPSVDVELLTGADGRTVFLAGLDYPYEPLTCKVTVTAPNTPPHETECSTRDGEWTIVVPKAPHALPQQLDLALVIDVTGSMTDELEYLKAEIDEIAARVKDKYPNITQRFGLVVYRDHGDEFVTRKFDFTESLTDFQKNLSAQRAAGGGDYPEAVPEALEAALSLQWSNDGAARVAFLVGDAPPHAGDTGRTFQAVNTLRKKGVSVFPVGASGVKDEAEYLFRAAAFVTQGQYLFLTDHSGVGSPHAKPQAARYEVERLDQLMIRMIAWKLSGEEYQADRVIDVGGTEIPSTSALPPAGRSTHTAVPSTVLPAAPSPAVSSTSPSHISFWEGDAFQLLWKGTLAVAVVGVLLGNSLWSGWKTCCRNAGDEARSTT